MKQARPWTLSSRMTRALALMTAALTLLVSSVGGLFVYSSLERELTGLVNEELEELELILPTTAGLPQAFVVLGQRLREEHPANPMAFRVWPEDGGAPHDWGAIELIDDEVPGARPDEAVSRASGGRRWRTRHLASGELVGAVVDGSAQFALLHRFGLTALGLTVFAALLAFVAGTIFVRRSCGMLKSVAEQARAVRAPSAAPEIDVEGAPEEIRAVADALAQMLSNIHAESERARLLTAGMAHELGSPIQNLIGEAQVGLMGEKPPAEYRAILESQLEELRDLARTVGNLIALCSVEEASRAGELERFDLGEEAHLRLARERAHAARRGVEVDLLTEGDLRVTGDREALLLALSNLVSNAVDWSPDGGRVVARLAGGPAGLTVTVDDQGPGVPEAERERVFEPFYRGPASRGRRQGYGLGLSITRAAVEAHGGTLSIDRSPAGGARFALSLVRERGGDHDHAA